MPRPLLKTLCPSCHGISLLDSSATSLLPLAYRCTHCGEFLHLMDRYTLVEGLGERTFLALDWHREPPSPCVVQREFPPRSTGESILDRLLSLAPHPQLPRVHGYFQQGGLGYLVQDYCPGRRLTQWITRETMLTDTLGDNVGDTVLGDAVLGDAVLGENLPGGTLPSPVVMRMVQTLLSILSGIHQQGLLHGDVKPANILVPAGQPNTWTTQGLFLTQLRLVDWGNAQEPANPLPPWLMATNHHQRASAEYAAPEQLAGQPHFASDLYSVGVVGVQLLTGIAPFHWLDQGENWRLFVSHTPVNLDADLDADLCAQLDRLLNPDPHQRYGPRRSVPSAPPELIAKPVPWQLQFNLSGSQGHRAAVKALASPFEVTNPTNTSSVIPSITPFETNIPQWFASAGEDHTLRLWSYKTGELLTSVIIPHKPIQALCIEPEFPHRLLSGSADGRLQGWEIRENPDHTLDLRPLVNLHWQQPGALNALVCVAPEIFASGGTDKAIYLWHLDHPQPLITLTGHRLAIQTLAVSPESRYLASGSSDATVKIWDLSRKNLITTLKGHTAAVKTVAFSPDGQYLASAGNDRTIQLWDTQHWRIQFTLPGHGWPITQLKFTNPQTLWSSSWDYTLKCWDLSNLFRGEMQEPLQPIAHLQEHTDVVTCFIVMSHGVLISGSADHTVKIWHQHRLP